MPEFLPKLSRFIKDRFVGEPPPVPPASPDSRPVPPPSPDSRSDLEYENILWVLLEEVEQGKSWGQLQGLLIANRLDAKRLAQWLQSYGDRWLEQPESNQELARRLVKLGQVATRELGTVARVLGERLLVPSPSEVNSGNSLAAGSANSGAIAQSDDSEGRGGFR